MAAQSQGGRRRERSHVCGASLPGVSGSRLGRLGRRGRPRGGVSAGAERGWRGRRRSHAALHPSARAETLFARRAAGPASPASTRARAAHAPASAPRSRPLLPSHRAGSACLARGRGPGVQRGPRWGPAPRLGRMRPGAARELSRAPAPAPSLRIRNRCPAPERHDFQAAFRLDSLQVRGRRSPPSLQLGDAAHYPLKGRVCAQKA